MHTMYRALVLLVVATAAAQLTMESSYPAVGSAGSAGSYGSFTATTQAPGLTTTTTTPAPALITTTTTQAPASNTTTGAPANPWKHAATVMVFVSGGLVVLAMMGAHNLLQQPR